MKAQDAKELLQNLTKKDNDEYMVLEGRLIIERYLGSGGKIEYCLGVAEAIEKVRAYAGIKNLEEAREKDLEQIMGFSFHRGLIAIAKKPSIPSIEDEYGLCNPNELAGCPDTPDRLVICPSISDPGNLGTIIRSAEAFGWQGMAIGTQSTSPWSRKSIRASMGSVFYSDIVTISKKEDLDLLSFLGYILIAADLNKDSIPLNSLSDQIKRLENVHGCPQKIALILGHEFEGIPDDWIMRSKHRVRIPTTNRVDSLNVAQAAAIIMYSLSLI